MKLSFFVGPNWSTFRQYCNVLIQILKVSHKILWKNDRCQMSGSKDIRKGDAIIG